MKIQQRVRFTKLGKIRFLSHRDLARVWERSLRRSGVQVAYSEGFSPRPRLSFGLALSTGHESLGEYLDIDLAQDVDPVELPGIVNPALPSGMVAQIAIPIEPGILSLQQAVTSSSWRITLAGIEADQVAEGLARVMGAVELPIVVERKGNKITLDARPAILALRQDDVVLEAELASQPRSLRPAELLRAIDPTWGEGRVLRTHQWTLVDGARSEPIPFGDVSSRGATPTPHAGARV
jgi:radical SAM-linked protein